MGQYHTIYNKTKREYFSIGGAKLWEKSNSVTATALLLLLSNSNGRGGGDIMIWPENYKNPTIKEKMDQRLIDAVSGRWAGDEIVVQGDYAKPKDPGFIDNDQEYKNISTLVVKALLAADCGGSEITKILNIEIAMGMFPELKPKRKIS